MRVICTFHNPECYFSAQIWNKRKINSFLNLYLFSNFILSGAGTRIIILILEHWKNDAIVCLGS